MQHTPSTIQRWLRLWRHLWQSDAAWQAVPDAMAARLSARVHASEQRHSGQIAVCIEGALPLSYIGRADRQAPLPAVVRQRAMTWFGRLRIWDTEHNNGVLIYLLLAERRIEVLADRGVMRHVHEAFWPEAVQRLREHLKQGDFETGLTLALEEVSALLVLHFPVSSDEVHPNELPDLVVRA
jgi:uncharacterized membrane protein